MTLRLDVNTSKVITRESVNKLSRWSFDFGCFDLFSKNIDEIKLIFGNAPSTKNGEVIFFFIVVGGICCNKSIIEFIGYIAEFKHFDIKKAPFCWSGSTLIKSRP